MLEVKDVLTRILACASVIFSCAGAMATTSAALEDLRGPLSLVKLLRGVELLALVKRSGEFFNDNCEYL